MDWLALLAVQGTLKSILQYHNSKASILQCSAFFIAQLSHPYMTTGKTIALTRWTFVGKERSLLFNMLSGLVMRRQWQPTPLLLPGESHGQRSLVGYSPWKLSDFTFLCSKITADGDCSQEIKRRLFLGRKAMTNLDSILKRRDITLPTKYI